MKDREKKDQPKDRIIRSAKKEFSERGFSGARMSGIARRAAVNKALIHYYFKDKETLYFEVLKSFFTGAGAMSFVPDYLGKWELSASQKLYIIIYIITNIFLKATDPEAIRIIFWELAEGTRYLDSLVMEYNIPRQEILADVVREGIRNGEFETGYPLLSVMNIVSFITMYRMNKEIYKGKQVFARIYGDADEKDVFEYVLELVFKSLAPKNRKLEIPTIPEGLMTLLEKLINVLIAKKDEGVNDEVFKRVENILQQ